MTSSVNSPSYVSFYFLSLISTYITTKVLDEADEMLNKGFKEQIYDVYRYLPPSTQVRFYQNRIAILEIYQWKNSH